MECHGAAIECSQPYMVYSRKEEHAENAEHALLL